MAGIAWDVKLMHLKVGGRYFCLEGEVEGYCFEYSSENAGNAIEHAWNRPDPAERAIALNMSFGDSPPIPNYNEFERAKLNSAKAGNLLAVCAAGNDGADLDAPGTLVSPACIPTDNVISVGGTNSSDTDRAGAYNFGRYQVDLGAPSIGVLSLGTSSVTAQSGTSYSAPQVTGAVALIKTKYPWESYIGLRDRVLMGVDVKGALADDFRTSGRLNVEKALLPRTVIRNLSTRARVADGDGVMIGGFIVGGSASGGDLRVAIRGLGPTVPVNTWRLGNPKIELYKSGNLVAENYNWRDSQEAEIIATGIPPQNDLEAMMVRSLSPGAYTVILRDEGSAHGVGMFEVYELEEAQNQESRLRNVSTRCLVGFGDNRAIAGAIVSNPMAGQPENLPRRRMLILGSGPRLKHQGIPSEFLPNPYLELAGAVAASNDRWEDIDGNSIGLQSELTENDLKPAPGHSEYEPEEAALWPTFSSGQSFSAILSPASGSGEGIGLIEFYEY